MALASGAERRARVLGRCALALGLAVAAVGAAGLAAWLGGYMAERGLSGITMKTNTALCLLLLGAALALLPPAGAGRVPRRAAVATLAAVPLVLGALTICEDVAGWDFGIDQLLASEAPGALAVTSPNRMGLPASASSVLAAAALLAFVTGRRSWVSRAQVWAVVVVVIGLVSTVGHLYGARPLYALTPLTAIAWTTAVSLSTLGLGLLCARPSEGLMAQVTREDAGGANFRRLLLPVLLLPLVAGWLWLAGERSRLFDAPLGIALLMVLFVLSFTVVVFRGSERVSRAGAALVEADAERERLLVQVSEERTRLGTVLERLPVGVLIADAAGTIAFANARAQRVLGPRAAPGADAAAWEASRADGAPLLRPQLPVARALRGESVAGQELLLTGEHERRWTLSVSAAPLLDESGAVSGAVVAFDDVTARNLVEQALQRSESELQAIVENVDQGVIVAGPDGRLLHWNGAALAMHGLGPGEAVHGPVGRLAEVFEFSDLAGNVLSYEGWPLLRILRGERLHDCELRVRHRAQGWQRVFSCGGTLVRDTSGRSLLALLTIADITVRRQAELELRTAKASAERAMAAAEEASRAKDKFIAVLSHELRTPLAPVLAGVALLEREAALSQEAREIVGVMRRNVELESRLIDDLLDVTRIVRGKLTLQKRRVELCGTLERALEICGPEIEARRLRVGVDLGPRPYLADADAARLQQVFWNLLKNAVKFTPEGGRIGVRCRPRDGQLVVEVQDSGIGIEPSALVSIFDAFVQETRAGGHRFGGLGLGLMISKALVEMHGGTIEARSGGAGTGATFEVRLPILAYGRGADGGDAPAEAPANAPPRRCLQVLLVEDHADTAEMMEAVLSRAGHRVRTAGDAEAAVAAAAAEPFDVLVSDLGLPGRGGLELVRELRSCGKAARAIALSGYGREEDIEASRAAGFDAHLVKPVEPQRLLEVIEEVTAPRPPGAAPAATS